METTELAPFQTDELKQQIEPVIADANAITINSAETFEGAVNFLQTVKATQKTVRDFWEPLKTKAHEAHKAIVARENLMLKPLIDAETAVKTKASAYQQAEERKRRAEEARLQAIADENARKERERLEREAARLKTPERKEERLAAAAAVVAPVISVAPAVPKFSGVSNRQTWKARVIDPMAVPREYLLVNQQALDAFARSTKGAIPMCGVEFFSETSMAVGGVR